MWEEDKRRIENLSRFLGAMLMENRLGSKYQLKQLLSGGGGTHPDAWKAQGILTEHATAQVDPEWQWTVLNTWTFYQLELSGHFKEAWPY